MDPGNSSWICWGVTLLPSQLRDILHQQPPFQHLWLQILMGSLSHTTPALGFRLGFAVANSSGKNAQEHFQETLNTQIL